MRKELSITLQDVADLKGRVKAIEKFHKKYCMDYKLSYDEVERELADDVVTNAIASEYKKKTPDSSSVNVRTLVAGCRSRAASDYMQAIESIGKVSVRNGAEVAEVLAHLPTVKERRRMIKGVAMRGLEWSYDQGTLTTVVRLSPDRVSVMESHPIRTLFFSSRSSCADKASCAGKIALDGIVRTGMLREMSPENAAFVLKFVCRQTPIDEETLNEVMESIAVVSAANPRSSIFMTKAMRTCIALNKFVDPKIKKLAVLGVFDLE